uniref:Uncharacterized protein n=1 Tax=Panagrolaimus superbus TaxID=310955 RepID=A0A914Y7C9_9BILA
MRFIFIYLSIIWVVLASAQNDEMVQTSGRLFRDVMEMFVPSSENRRSSSLPRETTPEASTSNFISNLLPPFGINRQMPSDDSTASHLTSSSASLVSSVSNLFKQNPSHEDIEPNHPLMPVGNTDRVTSNVGQWSSIAKDVMGLFTVHHPVTTTTIPPPISGLDMLNPRFIQQLMPDWMQPLNPYRKPSEDLRRSPMQPQHPPPILNAQSIFGPWTGILDNNSPATQVDTGGNTFDRLVVRENADPDDPLGSLMGGKFNEKGIQWSDGNIKLVNKNGNKLLGSEVAVRDRSISVPIQRWFDIANNLVTAYSNPDPSRF